MNPRILVFAGSIRSGAWSGRTADAAMKELALQGADVTRISLADYPLPIMDEDLERREGIPDNAVKLGLRNVERISNCLVCALRNETIGLLKRMQNGQQRPFHVRMIPDNRLVIFNFLQISCLVHASSLSSGMPTKAIIYTKIQYRISVN